MELEPMTTIAIAKDYSPYPAGRYAEDGPYNGARFRDEFVLPALKRAKRVRVILDGVATLPSSFWQETWGGLVSARGITEEQLKQQVEISTTEPDLQRYVELAWNHVHEATTDA